MWHSIIVRPILILPLLVVSFLLLELPLLADLSQCELGFRGEKVDSKLMVDYSGSLDTRRLTQDYIIATEHGMLFNFVNPKVISASKIRRLSTGKTVCFSTEDDVSDLKIAKNQTGSSSEPEGVSCGGTITGLVTSADRGSLMFTIDDSLELRAASDRIFRTRVRVGKKLECQTYSQDSKCIAYGCRTIEELPKTKGD